MRGCSCGMTLHAPYSYVQNDPVNFVDPSGLTMALTCMVDGVQAYCSAAFALVNMGAGVIYGGTGWYGEGEIFVIDHLYFNDRQLNTWQSIFFQNPQNTQQPKNFDGNGIPRDGTQSDYNFCVSQAMSRYRRTYLKTSAKAIVGGAGIGAGLSVGIGIRGVGFGVRGAAHLMKDLSVPMLTRVRSALMEFKDSSMIATTVSVFSGKLALDGIREGGQNSATTEAEINGCMKRYPHADHGFWF